MITAQTDLQELFDLAMISLNEVNSGEVFLVKDLFRGFEWNRIPKGIRTKLGSMVFAKVEGCQRLGKTAQNQQMYQKI